MATFKEIALDMIGRGMRVTPLKASDKKPLLLEWQLSATSDPAVVEQWDNKQFDDLNSHYNGTSMAFNVGCVCTTGAGNLCVLDIDADGVLEQMYLESGHTIPETFTVQSRPESAPFKKHFYFRQTPYSVEKLPKTVGANNNGGRYDFKVNGQTVAAGSIHPKTNKPYAVMTDYDIVPIPDWLVDWIDKDRAKYKAEEGEGFQAAKAGDFFGEGQRYPYLRSLSVKLRLAGASADAIYETLREHAINFCAGSKDYADKNEEKLRKLAEDAEHDFNSEPVVYIADGEKHKAAWTTLSTVQKKKIDWLWDGKFPLKAITAVTGDPSLGKTTFMLDMIARGSAGMNWLDGKENKQGAFKTILLSAEDDTASVIVPRLEAMGADLDNVIIPTVDHEWNLDRDLAIVEDVLEYHSDIRLIVVDPLSNYIPTKNMMNEQQIRSVIMPLNKLCQKYNVALICIFHNSKQSGRQAIHKTVGAIGNIGACRMGWTFVRDPEDPKNTLCLQMKYNYGRFDGIKFTTKAAPVEVEGQTVYHAAIEFIETTTEEADAVIQKTEASRFAKPKEPNLAQLIQSWIKPGGKKQANAMTAGIAGIGNYTLTQVKSAMSFLGIHEVEEDGTKYWVRDGGTETDKS